MFVFFHLVNTVKAIGDVNVTNGAIGAVAGPGAHIGTASVVSKLQYIHLPNKDEGVPKDPTMHYCSPWQKERDREMWKMKEFIQREFTLKLTWHA